ncbi:hypothetical protein [Streptomyces sp. 4N124]|uniref:hypothetical protein n=1 Tax=Streptomyces sp. 4N124 TaxID=3457420 RepID=UPI003FD26B06
MAKTLGASQAARLTELAARRRGDGCSAPGGLEVHSPHLPSARALLEQPLLHTGPHDVRRIRELRPKFGDPVVREALDLLARALEDRFGGDIALGRTE